MVLSESGEKMRIQRRSSLGMPSRTNIEADKNSHANVHSNLSFGFGRRSMTLITLILSNEMPPDTCVAAQYEEAQSTQRKQTFQISSRQMSY